jgi:hypothetical protein
VTISPEAELIKLLKEYQKQLPDSEEGIEIKTNIIEKLSKLYWWGAYISNLFPKEVKQNKAEFQQELKAKLEFDLKKNNDCAKLAKSLINAANDLIGEYENKLITEKFVNSLAIVVKNSQANKPQRIQAQQRLIKAMDILNTYKRQGLRDKFLNLSEGDYQNAYSEATKESVRYVLTRINEYDENKSFMALINHWMPSKFNDAVMRIAGIKKSQADKEEEDKIKIYPEDPTSVSFTNKIEENYERFISNKNSAYIRQIIEKDPKNILSKKIRKDRPNITFKTVLLAIVFDDIPYKTLSTEWGIPYTTIHSFYVRELEKIKFELAEYLQ